MKFGFIDLYLDEWHANHYPEWLKQVCPEGEVAFAWAEENQSPNDGKTSEEWCNAFGVTLCKTPEEVCRQSDGIFLLAPSNPEAHLRLAEQVLPYGKPTYIDKTFAPDVETAKKIFALAKEYGTPVFTTSALRYAEETEGTFAKAFVTGGGRSLEEYIVHPVEMAVKILGTGAENVTAYPMAGTEIFRITYGDGREGALQFGAKLPFALTLTDTDGTPCHRPVKSDFFPALMAEAVEFFKTKVPPVSEEETLEVMGIRQAILQAAQNPGTEIAVPR